MGSPQLEWKREKKTRKKNPPSISIHEKSSLIQNSKEFCISTCFKRDRHSSEFQNNREPLFSSFCRQPPKLSEEYCKPALNLVLMRCHPKVLRDGITVSYNNWVEMEMLNWSFVFTLINLNVFFVLFLFNSTLCSISVSQRMKWMSTSVLPTLWEMFRMTCDCSQSEKKK